MATGACGINCDVCGLKVQGTCNGCQPGIELSDDAVTQHPCPVLKCAVGRGVAFCLRDCQDFPCTIMEETGFPFGLGYLSMHRQRMAEGH